MLSATDRVSIHIQGVAFGTTWDTWLGSPSYDGQALQSAPFDPHFLKRLRHRETSTMSRAHILLAGLTALLVMASTGTSRAPGALSLFVVAFLRY